MRGPKKVILFQSGAQRCRIEPSALSKAQLLRLQWGSDSGMGDQAQLPEGLSGVEVK
jgi:hypothetical protein